MTVRRYTNREIADAWTEYRMAIKGFSVPYTLEFVDAAHYDALAADREARHQSCLVLMNSVTQYRARVQALEAALRKHSRHSGDCRVYARSNLDDCTCGLTAVLNEIKSSQSSPAATSETACEHDLQKPNCTVEVAQLAKVQRGECAVCNEVWINPPYGALAFQSNRGGEPT
jgi:hypothetical protein